MEAKGFEIVPYPLHLGNVSKDFSNDNIKKTRLNWYLCNFSVHYKAFDKSDIVNICKYFMVKNKNVLTC